MYLDLTSCWDYPKGDAQSLPSIRDFSALKSIDTSVGTWGDLLLQPKSAKDAGQGTQDIANGPLENTTERLHSRLPPH